VLGHTSRIETNLIVLESLDILFTRRISQLLINTKLARSNEERICRILTILRFDTFTVHDFFRERLEKFEAG
jgi:hypothetical protein